MADLTVARRDALTKQERSAHMARVRGCGNRSTELPVVELLQADGVEGWELHPSDIPGRPDIVFRKLNLALFVDGCFWHGCPVCKRRTPRTRSDFWSAKIASNRRRDGRTTRTLRSQGYRVLRLWEHSIRAGRWQSMVRRMLTRVGVRRGASTTAS